MYRIWIALVHLSHRFHVNLDCNGRINISLSLSLSITAALEARTSYLTEDETSELLELVTELGSTMESIVKDMRQEVANALKRENETENHPQIGMS